MKLLISVMLIFMVSQVRGNETFHDDAEREIRGLINQELMGHYNVSNISILEVKEQSAGWDESYNYYGIRTVVASFLAIRNEEWHASLNRDVLADNCDKSSVWLLCRPEGHRFEGKVKVDVVATVSGWKILNRNFRNIREFVLSGYLLLEGRQKEGYVLSPIK